MTRTRAHAVLATLFLTSSLVAAGCSGSHRSPITGGVVTIDGSLTDTNGQPIAGREVILWNNSVADLLLLFPLAVIPRDRTVTDAAGDFRLTENGVMANGFFGARPFLASLSVGHWTEPTANVRFKLMSQTQSIPTLQLWSGNGTATPSGDDMDFSWDALSGAQYYRLELWNEQIGLTAVDVGGNTNASVPRRLLQDFSVRWAPRAVSDVIRPNQTMVITNRGQVTSLPNQGLVPPTRGQVASADGWGLAPGLTDGKLDTVSFIPVTGGQPSTTQRIEIDLGSVHSLEEVYLYDWSDDHWSGVVVGVFNAPGGSAQANPDATSFEQGTLSLQLPAGTSGRYLVIQPYDPAAVINDVAEVSAF